MVDKASSDWWISVAVKGGDHPDGSFQRFLVYVVPLAKWWAILILLLNLASACCILSLGTWAGAGINFNPFPSALTWAGVSLACDRFRILESPGVSVEFSPCSSFLTG